MGGDKSGENNERVQFLESDGVVSGIIRIDPSVVMLLPGKVEPDPTRVEEAAASDGGGGVGRGDDVGGVRACEESGAVPLGDKPSDDGWRTQERRGVGVVWWCRETVARGTTGDVRREMVRMRRCRTMGAGEQLCIVRGVTHAGAYL